MRAQLRGLSVLCVGLIVMAGIVVAPLPAAFAEDFHSVVSSTADMYWCTSKQTDPCINPLITQVSKRDHVRMVCWRDDRPPFQRAPDPSRWFYIIRPNGQEGYLWSGQIDPNTQTSTHRCAPDINWIDAADWAIGHMNQASASPAEAAQYSTQDWSPGPVGEWQGDCVKFAQLAWGGPQAPGIKGYYGDAIDVYNKYAAVGRIGQGRPPRGAMVFFGATSYNGGKGHVAVSIGNWWVVGTHGMDNENPVKLTGRNTIQELATAMHASYLGWTMPQDPPSWAIYNQVAQ